MAVRTANSDVAWAGIDLHRRPTNSGIKIAWTDERVERLKVLFAEGLSASQIAAELGDITRNAVIGKLTRLGMNRGRAPRRKPWVSSGISERTWQRRKHTTTVRPPQARRIAIKGHGEIIAAKYADEIVDLAPDQSEHPLTIMELENCHCRWPLGTPSVSMLYCADPTADVVNGRPYCGRHHRIAHDRPSYYQRRQEWAARNGPGSIVTDDAA